jgi:hypothetical protein
MNDPADTSAGTTPPPKRPFWQIHLSTAVVMMVLSGVFIWLNASPAIQRRESHDEYRVIYETSSNGFPVTFLTNFKRTNYGRFVSDNPTLWAEISSEGRAEEKGVQLRCQNPCDHQN